MPTYQYRCTECDAELEVVQKFSDDALTVCPECDGRLRKVYNAVGVVFKGSGFYATDNRAKKHGTGKPKAESAEPSTQSEKKSPAASSSTEKTPAA
jgi:putative FmdB family regulatory protein